MRCRLLAPVLLVALAAGPARADTEGGRVGVGGVAGLPTGVTAQVRLAAPRLGSALNFAVGLDAFDNNGIYLHLDYVVSVVELVRASSVSLPVYLGGGAFVRDKADPSLGLRVPLGLQVDLRHTRVHLFGEAVLRLGLVDGVDAAIRGAVGVRYFF